MKLTYFHINTFQGMYTTNPPIIKHTLYISHLRMMPRFMKRLKSPDYKDRNVFGVPLLQVLQQTGLPLPQTILYAMRFLRRTSNDAVGIFRKPGVRSRIQQLKRLNESNPGITCLNLFWKCRRLPSNLCLHFLFSESVFLLVNVFMVYLTWRLQKKGSKQ